MTRPAILFPLFAGIETLDGIGPRMAQLFAQIGVTRPRDLILTLPYAGIDRRLRASIREVVPPATVTVAVTVGTHVPPRKKGGPARVFVRDGATEFQLVYFHQRGDQLQKILPTGQRRIVSGKVEIFDGIAQIVHPDHVLRPEEAKDLPDWEPVYPLTAGLTQRVVAKAVAGMLARLPDLPEWIDPAQVAREGWGPWAAAVRAAHRPGGPDDLAVTAPARARLAYDELFAHQLTLALARRQARRGKGRASVGTGAIRDRILAAVDYAPTGAQTRALAEIAADMGGAARMVRLLQGDVGSGKTLVALLALAIAAEAGGQGVLMAPTEILARQHFDTLAPLADAAGLRLALLTGRDKGAERAAKLAALAAGDTQVLIGTRSSRRTWSSATCGWPSSTNSTVSV
jgi:ATP-dependent DNA helicase RecG